MGKFTRSAKDEAEWMKKLMPLHAVGEGRGRMEEGDAASRWLARNDKGDGERHADGESGSVGGNAPEAVCDKRITRKRKQWKKNGSPCTKRKRKHTQYGWMNRGQ